MSVNTSRPELLTVKEVAHLLRVTPLTVYKRAHNGQIPAIRIGEGQAGIRIPRDELYEMLYANPAESDVASA